MSDLSTLTRREREIAELAVEGLTAAEIGQRVFLATATVKNHLTNIYWKLGITRGGGGASRIALVRLMLRGQPSAEPQPDGTYRTSPDPYLVAQYPLRRYLFRGASPQEVMRKAADWLDTLDEQVAGKVLFVTFDKQHFACELALAIIEDEST